MTVCEVMAKINEIDSLCDLWRQKILQKADTDRMAEILQEYRQVLLERKVVG